jgi:hypothetical protein
MTIELYWSRLAFASEHPNLITHLRSRASSILIHRKASRGLRNADYDPKRGCCSSQEKPVYTENPSGFIEG